MSGVQKISLPMSGVLIAHVKNKTILYFRCRNCINLYVTSKCYMWILHVDLPICFTYGRSRLIFYNGICPNVLHVDLPICYTYGWRSIFFITEYVRIFSEWSEYNIVYYVFSFGNIVYFIMFFPFANIAFVFNIKVKTISYDNLCQNRIFKQLKSLKLT